MAWGAPSAASAPAAPSRPWRPWGSASGAAAWTASRRRARTAARSTCRAPRHGRLCDSPTRGGCRFRSRRPGRGEGGSRPRY
eukprot:759854-Hanusia_phi.AAC.1